MWQDKQEQGLEKKNFARITEQERRRKHHKRDWVVAISWLRSAVVALLVTRTIDDVVMKLMEARRRLQRLLRVEHHGSFMGLGTRTPEKL